MGKQLHASASISKLLLMEISAIFLITVGSCTNAILLQVHLITDNVVPANPLAIDICEFCDI